MADEPDSPLAGVAYDARRGEYDLQRFVPSRRFREPFTRALESASAT